MDYIFSAKESVVVTNNLSEKFVGTTVLNLLMNNVALADFNFWEDLGDTLNRIYNVAQIDALVGEWKQIAMLSNESENLIPTPTPDPKFYCDILVKMCEHDTLKPRYVSFSVIGGIRSTDTNTYLPNVIDLWIRGRFGIGISYMLVNATCKLAYESEEEE